MNDTPLPYVWGPRVSALNLISLGLLVWGLSSQAHIGTSGRHLAAAVLLAVAAAAWTGWVALRAARAPGWAFPLLVVMAVAGGGLIAFASLAAVFMGVSALGCAAQYGSRHVVVAGSLGCAAMAVSLALFGHDGGAAVGGVAGVLAGAAMGVTRRQSQEHVAQQALVRFEHERAQVEHQRAQLLAERNHLGRELHDVLAHTLSALAVQLEALDSVVCGGAPAEEVQRQMDRSKTLVREGLAEARRAVHALRTDPAPLVDQVSVLTQADGAELSVAGEPRPLSPEVSHALYRAAQEALANVAKYGHGAKAAVTLEFEPESVRLKVTNAGPTGDGVPGPAANAGDGGPHGGYGLQGMRERALALGGKVQAGPDGTAWRVEMELPG